MTTTAPASRVRIDLTYAVEPLAKLLYYAATCGQQDARGLPQPSEEDAAKFFAGWFPVESQEAYRGLARKGLQPIQDQLDDAVADAGERLGVMLATDELLEVENELDHLWAGDPTDVPPWYRPIARLRYHADREAHGKAAELLRSVRLELERPK